MGCVCCSLATFTSNCLHALERISLCTACAILTCCLLITILTVMVIGVGIGYHYCFVQNQVEQMAKASKAISRRSAAADVINSGLTNQIHRARRDLRNFTNETVGHRTRRELRNLTNEMLGSDQNYTLSNNSDDDPGKTVNKTHYSSVNHERVLDRLLKPLVNQTIGN